MELEQSVQFGHTQPEPARVLSRTRSAPWSTRWTWPGRQPLAGLWQARQRPLPVRAVPPFLAAHASGRPGPSHEAFVDRGPGAKGTGRTIAATTPLANYPALQPYRPALAGLAAAVDHVDYEAPLAGASIPIPIRPIGHRPRHTAVGGPKKNKHLFFKGWVSGW